MATKTMTVLVDDIDGSDADQTVSFQLDGVSYDIDLNAAHASELRSILRPYIQAGRKQRPSTSASRRASAGRAEPTNADVRAWAQEQGIAVNSRGRVGAEILAQYAAAH